ncbi:MAG: hypothetical protein AAF989_16050, partial [Planctomycetota bacterium]
MNASDPMNNPPQGALNEGVYQNPYGSAPPPNTYDGPPIRPLGVTIIMVVTILVGILGLGSAMFGAAGLVFGEWLANSFTPDGDEAALQMQLELQEVSRQFLIPNVLLLICGFVVSIGYLTGGVGLAISKAWSGKLLRNVFLASVILDFLRMGLGIVIQRQNAPIMRRMFQQQSQNGPDLSQMTDAFIWLGIGLSVIWLLVTAGLKLWGRFY